MGCSSPRIEEGSTEQPGARQALVQPVPCPSLGGARPMLPGEAIPRAPSLHRGGALPGASVLASQEATPPQGVRGEGRQKAWLLGVISRPDPNAGRARPGRWLAIAPDEQSSRRMETSVAGERGGGPLARGVGFLAQARSPERGQRREPRAEEDSRLAGVPARRSCVAELGRHSQAQRSPIESRRILMQVGF